MAGADPGCSDQNQLSQIFLKFVGAIADTAATAGCDRIHMWIMEIPRSRFLPTQSGRCGSSFFF
jgi:hypothetical protein